LPASLKPIHIEENFLLIGLMAVVICFYDAYEKWIAMEADLKQ